MSANITCYAADENPAVDRARQHCTRKAAKKKVSRGSHRWLDDYSIQEIVIAVVSTVRPFFFGPSAMFTDWQPRPSSGYLVMQLHTRREHVAK